MQRAEPSHVFGLVSSHPLWPESAISSIAFADAIILRSFAGAETAVSNSATVTAAASQWRIGDMLRQLWTDRFMATD